MNNRISPVGGGVAGVAVAAAVVAAEPTPWDLWLWVALDVSGAARLASAIVLAFRVFNPPADAAGLFNPV